MPLEGRRTARLWTEFNRLREALNTTDATPDNPADAEALLTDLLKVEAARDFGDEDAQPPAVIDADQRVGVLLPIRIETRFRQQAGNWTLRLRLFPEPIAFDQRPRPVPGETRKADVERRALETFWTSASGTLASPDAPGAFRRL